ncbi:MAG: hydantoinase/oxoprolinase family protein [Acidimicrobiia bacterium]
MAAASPPAPGSGVRPGVRLAADIGGTFTDVVLERADGALHTRKLLTTHAAPERAVLEGMAAVLAEAGVAPGDVSGVVHGTTLATNALIERTGAVTGLLTTDGFRDTVEIAHEDRFEQYDLLMERPAPLVPRELRIGVRQRHSARGDELVPLDQGGVRAAAATFRRAGVTSVAIGFLHAYVDDAHERRAAAILAEELPGVWLTLASQVCPEIREYERFSTACANAYVQPLVASYLQRLAGGVAALGIAAPLFLLQSSGGLCTLEQAVRQPVVLVESGPAGGAILAARLARQHRIERLLSFDMGGTTAKLCLVEDGVPATARDFEVARRYRFLRGSGLPLRIPVIDMVEIGAGGGSLAAVDALGRVTVGPQSAGSEPGPACYGLGGTRPAVTDADLVLGRLDPAGFAAGTMTLSVDAAEAALADAVAQPLGLPLPLAAYAVSEVVEENMAAAARVHAVERGRDVRRCTMVAFGGAAPLHACRLADKLGIDRVIVPAGAGVGSAIGFLRAAVSYEAVRTAYQRLDAFDPAAAAAVVAAMAAEAAAVVGSAAPGAATVASCRAAMRYVGQGHELDVPIPTGTGSPNAWPDADELHRAFETAYDAAFARTIPGLAVEVLSWVYTLSTVVADPPTLDEPAWDAPALVVTAQRPAFEAAVADWCDHAVVARAALGALVVRGPAVVVEDQTTTVVGAGWSAALDGDANLVLRREPSVA